MYKDLSEIDTPAVLVDPDVTEGNLKRAADMVKAHGVRLRPHIKTHKSPYFSHRQLALGAGGITVAKIGEAEVMAEAGITDILLAYPPIGKLKLRRLAGLLEQAHVTVSLDSVEAAEGVSQLAQAIGKTIDIYIDVNTGLNRMGLLPGEETVKLAQRVAAMPGLHITGVMSHCGHIGGYPTLEELAQGARDDAKALVATAEAMRKAGIDVKEVSPGSTTGAPYHVEVEGVTEIRPGTYIFNDVNTVAAGICTEDQCAVTILATVVSRPASDRAVVDAGSKTLAADRSSKRGGHGIVKGYPSIVVRSLSEEHGALELTDPGVDLKVGDRIEIIPNHVCPVINLSDTVVIVRDGKVLWEMPVAARGRRT